MHLQLCEEQSPELLKVIEELPHLKDASKYDCMLCTQPIYCTVYIKGYQWNMWPNK